MSTTVGAYVIGTIAGTVGSLVGMGGSFVALPMLTARRMGLNMSQHTAIGTSMATVFFTSIGGCIAFASADGSPVARLLDRSKPLPTTVGNVHLPAATYLAATASTAAVAGARLSRALPARALKVSLGVFMLCMVPAAQLKHFLKTSATARPADGDAAAAAADTPHPFSPYAPMNVRCGCIGVCSGLLAGLFGVGGGAITVPALALFTPMDFRTILGTSLACMLPVATTGSLTHFMQGTMLPHIGLPLGMGSFTGSYLGGRLSAHIDEDYLRHGYSLLMAVLGTRTLQLALKMAK